MTNSVDFVHDARQYGLCDAEPDMDKLSWQLRVYRRGYSVQEALNNKIAKIGENMNIRRFANFAQPGCVYVGYVHGAWQDRRNCRSGDRSFGSEKLK